MSYASFALATFENLLATLDGLAEKAIHAGVDDDALRSRLASDMFPLELQFRVAINQVLLAFQQVGKTNPPLEETAYSTFAEVRERIAAVRERIAAARSEDWEAADAAVDLTLPNGVRFHMSAEQDIRDWILPNFYFHVSMAYALLRREGLTIGKMDFLPHMARYVAAAG